MANIGAYRSYGDDFRLEHCFSDRLLGVVLVPESNDLMTGSYVMIDPAGRFFDNVSGTHAYSRPINQVGVDAALSEVSVDPNKFRLRDGLYDW